MPYQIKNGIVYGSNAVSLTQAQYDALSTAEKNNGTVYYIYDVDDIYSGNVVKNVVLSASKWASDVYTITDPDITGTNIVFLTYPSSISDEMYSAIQSANIRVTNQANGSITLQALGGAPSINLTVTLIIQGIDMGLQTAEYVTYDNSTSGLEAVNVQEAVDELSGGLTKALSLNLLWQDANPPTSLSPTTISVDCSKYSLFMLVSHNYQASGTSVFFIYKGNTYNTYYVTSSGTSNFNTKSRTVQITDTSLIISEGYQGNNTSDNKVLVPYELYGVL